MLPSFCYFLTRSCNPLVYCFGHTVFSERVLKDCSLFHVETSGDAWPMAFYLFCFCLAYDLQKRGVCAAFPSVVVGGGDVNFCRVFVCLALFCDKELTGETPHSA